MKTIYDHLREVETKYMGEDLSGGNSRRAVAYAIEGWVLRVHGALGGRVGAALLSFL